MSTNINLSSHKTEVQVRIGHTAIMQTYSAIKGKSNSDDGNFQNPEHTILERRTISDDGFDSFPAYSRPAAQDLDADGDSENGGEGESEGEDEGEQFHSCDSDSQSYMDAKSHYSDLEGQVSKSTGGKASNPAPQKKKKQKRRRPKKKKKSSMGEDSVAGEAGEVHDEVSVAGGSTVQEGEARKLSPVELVAAMELLQLWKERSRAGR